MKKTLKFMMIFLVLFLIGCGGSSYDHADDVGKYMGSGALMVRSSEGSNDFCFLRSEFDSVRTSLRTDYDDVVEMRVYYFLEFEKNDSLGYAVISLSFSHPTEQVDVKPAENDWVITITYDLEEFETMKLESIAALDRFQDQSEALAQALRDADEDIDFNLSRSTGEYDVYQVYEFVDEASAVIN